MPFGRKRQSRYFWSWLAVLTTCTYVVQSMVSPVADAQGPGTPPPEKIFEGDSESLPVPAFMFLSESGSKVLMPGISWEEYERRMNLDSDADGLQQPFSYQSLQITGSTDGGRAEMEIVFKFAIESTDGRWIKMPLRMGNFHSLSPPDVSGIDEYSMTLLPDASGYVLAVKTDAVDNAMLRMRVSSRVQTESTRSIDFRLPDVPTQVRMTIDSTDIDGEIVGRGDETMTTEQTAGNQTQFVVESGGGNFAMRWGKLARSTDDRPLLEVESRVDVRWDSPDDQPIVSVRLTVRNAKGAIDGFRLRLPNGAVVLDTPRLGAGGQTIELGEVEPTESRSAVVDELDDMENRMIAAGPSSSAVGNAESRSGDVRWVTIPEEERQQRIDLNFDLQMVADNPSPNLPLSFHVPEIVGALRHRGEIVIRTGGDYRLRWRTRPWVRSEPIETTDEGLAGRYYRFRFDRGSFELPLWLSAKERQLRVSSKSDLSIRDGVASLTMDIQASGQAADGRLRLDEADWRISSVENLETGDAVESYRAESHRVVVFNLEVGDDTTAIRIRAERMISAADEDIRFEIPRVIADDENVLVQNATLSLTSSGRTVLVVDLPASKGLTRLASTQTESLASASLSTFRILSPDSPAILVGALVDQPPRIILSSDATIELDGDQLRSTVDWIVTSALDLEGRLPIRIPKSNHTSSPSSARSDELDGPSDIETFGDGIIGDGPSVATLDRFDGSENLADEPWVVTVDGVPATLRTLDDDRLELISERLTSGTMAIRWRHSQSRRSSNALRLTEPVSLPRPNIADVTIRGTMRVNLRGSQPFELTSTDSPPATTLELDALPREPLRLRLQSRSSETEEISVRQAVLRTIVGRSTRQEQVIASIHGGDSFHVELPPETPEVSVEATIDGTRVGVQRQDDTLLIPLAGDLDRHVIDLRVWISMSTPSSFAAVRPLLKLPFGAGRVFWQVIAPTDGHIVWASPTVGRSMAWRFENWKLYREPSHTDEALSRMIGGPDMLPDSRTPGNRYLYVGTDLASFEVVVVSRTVLWISVGSFVLLLAVLLTYAPQSRHPLTAVVIAVLFAGLLAIAPDAAVLAGQLGMIALVLVIVMVAIRALITPSSGSRVFGSPTPAEQRSPSTRSIRPVDSGNSVDSAKAKSIDAQSNDSDSNSSKPKSSLHSGKRSRQRVKSDSEPTPSTTQAASPRPEISS